MKIFEVTAKETTPDRDGDYILEEGIWDRIWNGPEDNFHLMLKAVKRMYQSNRSRNPKKDPRAYKAYMSMLQRKFPEAKPVDLARAIEQGFV